MPPRHLPGTIAAAFAAMLVLVCAAIAAPQFPQLSGRVVDNAALLDAGTKTSLTEKLDALEKQTTDQVVVVTLKSLQGETIEEYGFQLGEVTEVLFGVFLQFARGLLRNFM